MYPSHTIKGFRPLLFHVKKGCRIGYKQSKKISYYCFILPAFIVFISVLIFPLGFSFVLGFTQWKGYGEMWFAGLDNYIRMLTDPVFLIGVRNNIMIVLVSIFGQIPLGLLLAYMLHRKMVKKADLFEALIFLPITSSSVIVAQLGNFYRDDPGPYRKPGIHYEYRRK
ncbi:MAG: sugar ABC transporter permease [Treponema sp.]|nr:sugar ABC transporter permease [Treponema sp.]